MTKKNILIITTSNSKLGNSGLTTGVWLEELVTPYNLFIKADFKPIVASIAGGQIPWDSQSISQPYISEEGQHFLADPAHHDILNSSLSLSEIHTDNYAGIFLVGGHGTMWDFYPNEHLGQLIQQALQKGIPVGAVCHGVAGLLSYQQAASNNPLKGLKICGFSNQEEEIVGAMNVIPFSLENQLKSAGAEYVSGKPFEVCTAEDNLLITGQNPQSSLQTAQKLLERIQQR